MKTLVARWFGLLIGMSAVTLPARALDFETPIIGHWPRSTIEGAQGVVVSGKYAYLADGQRGVQIIDVADPANPRWVSNIATIDYAMNVICVTNHLYVADRNGGLNIIDVADPAIPQRVGVLNLTNCSDLDVSAGYVYLVRGNAGLAIVDVGQPSNPTLVTNVGIPGPALGVAAGATRAYVAFNAGFVTIDISEPSQPRTLSTNAGGYGIRLHQNVLYTGVAAFDVSNPDAPITLPTPPLSPWLSFYVSGGHFARIYGEDGIEFLDITSPSNSIRTGYFSAEWPAAYVADGYAYIIDRAPGYAPRDGGLYIAKLKERANPQRKATLSIGSRSGWETVVWNNYAYAAVHRFIYVYSISNAMSPVQVGTLDSSFRFAIENLAVGGDRLYASEANIVNVLDIRIPQSPVFLARFTNQVLVDDMVASSNYLFVAGGYSRPFMILDVTVPSQPRQIFESAGTVYDLDSFGDVLCLNVSAAGTYGFKLMDVSNPSAPQALCLFTNDAPIEHVCLRASFVYFTDSEYCLKAVDISNPAQPFLAGSSRLDQWWLSQLVVSDAFAYIAASRRGLLVYDISNPSRISYVGGNSSIECRALAPFAQSICAAGNTFSILDRFHPLGVAIAAGTNGLGLRISGPPRQPLTVQKSSNMVDWFDLISISPTNPPTTISVTNDNFRSFYRTVWH